MSKAVDLTMEEFSAFCHEKGMKCTAQRMAMFSALRERRLHPSVDEIWGLVKRTLPTGFVLPEGIRGEPHHWELRVSGICENCQSERKKERTIWIRRPCSRSATVSTC